MSPPPGEVYMKMEESDSFPVTGAASDKDWVSLAGRSFGYVRLGPVEEAQNILPIESESNSTTRFKPKRMLVITSFHELHCLRMLNAAFEKKWALQEAHIKHCLGYLRNGALCDSDLTLEPAGWEQRYSSQTGEGGDSVIHICRDWKQVHQAAHENWREWHAGEDGVE
jgi:hypothetical protein